MCHSFFGAVLKSHGHVDLLFQPRQQIVQFISKVVKAQVSICFVLPHMMICKDYSSFAG